MDDLWYTQLESKVFSQIEYMLKNREDAPFPNLTCTSVNENPNEADFPCLFLHELDPVERGNDLDNATVNAVMHTIEVQVWTNEGQTSCKNIINSAVLELKRLRYNIIMLPAVKTSSGISWGVCRARRIVGANDTF